MKNTSAMEIPWRKEGNVQAVEAEIGGLERIQACHPYMQRCDQENQGMDGTEPGKGC